jgi:hypothetical protein
MHAFHAYIDESGDEGFVFRDHPVRASSEWFVLSACVVRTKNLPIIARQIKPTLDQIEVDGRVAHFSRLPHDAKVAITECLGTKSIKTVSICVNKRALHETYENHTLGNRRRLYFYATRFLLERITWIARDYSGRGADDDRCKLIFSKCKNLSYEKMAKYLDELQNTNTQIAWPYIDLAATEVGQHNDSMWLRMADIVASATTSALELNRFGGWEDRYVLGMRKAMYRYRGKTCRSYGLKFFPSDPAESENGRYRWIATVFG